MQLPKAFCESTRHWWEDEEQLNNVKSKVEFWESWPHQQPAAKPDPPTVPDSPDSSDPSRGKKRKITRMWGGAPDGLEVLFTPPLHRSCAVYGTTVGKRPMGLERGLRADEDMYDVPSVIAVCTGTIQRLTNVPDHARTYTLRYTGFPWAVIGTPKKDFWSAANEPSAGEQANCVFQTVHVHLENEDFDRRVAINMLILTRPVRQGESLLAHYSEGYHRNYEVGLPAPPLQVGEEDVYNFILARPTPDEPPYSEANDLIASNGHVYEHNVAGNDGDSIYSPPPSSLGSEDDEDVPPQGHKVAHDLRYDLDDSETMSSAPDSPDAGHVTSEAPAGASSDRPTSPVWINMTSKQMWGDENDDDWTAFENGKVSKHAHALTTGFSSVLAFEVATSRPCHDIDADATSVIIV